MYWPWRGNINRREVKELTFICCGLPLSGAGLHTLCWNTTVSPLSCQRPHLTWLQLLFSVCVGMAMLAAPRAPCSASFLPDEARMCPKLPPPSPFAWGSSELLSSPAAWAPAAPPWLGEPGCFSLQKAWPGQEGGLLHPEGWCSHLAPRAAPKFSQIVNCTIWLQAVSGTEAPSA